MTVLSIITANVPLLKPFLRSVQSGLIDSSMPKSSSAYKLSTLGRSHKSTKQWSGEASGTGTRTIERRHRRLSNSNAPLATSSMAPSMELSLDFEDGSVSRESDMIGIHV